MPTPINPMIKRNMSYALMAMAMGTALGGEDIFDPPSNRKFLSQPQPKKCLLCGKEHNHNNSFCCSEHCREYRNKKR
jgi:hypothetical protein